MTAPRALRRLPAADPRRGERGVSILLAMLVLFVLVVVIFQVKFDATVELDQARASVANRRMAMVAAAAFLQARSALLMDIEQAQGGGEEGGGGAANPMGEDPPPEGGGEEGADGGADISDVIARTDSLLDDWQDSVSLQPPLGNDYTLWVEVVDEDSKLNLLGLWSPDEEQKTAVHEMVRNLLDKAFDGTSLDLSWTDATEILDNLDKWVKGDRGSFDPVPMPKLKKTNAEEEAEEGTLDSALLDDSEKNYPLTLDELLNIEGVLPEHLSGFVEDDVFHPGLEEYLTLWSQLELKPKPPEVDPFTGSPFTKGSLFDQDKIDNSTPGGEDGGEDGGEEGEGGDEPSDQPKPTNDGLVNINTAPLAVLRAIASDEIPTTFLEHIVEFRQRIVELRESGKLDMADEAFGAPDSVTGGMDEDPEEDEEGDTSFGEEDDDDPTKYVFEKPEDVIPKVEQEFSIELHAEIDVETEFVTRLAVNSQVFTVKVLVLDEQTGRRTSYRGVLWRMEGAEAPVMVSLVQLEPFYDARRLKDFPADIAEKSKERFERWTDEGYVAPH